MPMLSQGQGGGGVGEGKGAGAGFMAILAFEIKRNVTVHPTREGDVPCSHLCPLMDPMPSVFAV